MGSAKVSGVKQVRFALKSIADRVPDNARSQMKRSAARIVKLAGIMVPEDEGHLRDSIRIEKTYSDRGRIEIEIIAGGKNVTSVSGKTIRLDQYAIMVHEAYETSVAPNGPGKNTLEKMRSNPSVKIGSGFLLRAMQSEAPAFERVLVEIINRVIREEMS